MCFLMAMALFANDGVTTLSVKENGPFSIPIKAASLIYLPIEEQHEHRWCLWRPDHAGFDSRSIFEGALIEE